jgi:hypothetical protein
MEARMAAVVAVVALLLETVMAAPVEILAVVAAPE